jgi:threonine-phosphate decarboxylase
MPSDFLPAHGGQLHELASEFDIPESSLVDFSASIHPLPPSDALVATLCDAIKARRILTTYPDMHYSTLKQAIAGYVCVDVPAVTIGNGVMPLLDAAVRALGLRKCLVPVPAFTEYRSILGACGTEFCALMGAPGEGFSIDVGRVLAELKATGAQAVLLANPQSPSARLMHAEKLGRLHEVAFALGVTTIVDEAFIDYVPGQSLSKTAAESPGLVVLRSLTKFFAMPGLRVAYAVAHPETRVAIEAFVPAWPVDSIAAEAARLALQDQDSIAATRKINARERGWLADRLESLGLRVFPSAANYLLVKTDEERNGLDLWRRLVVEHRIVIRSCANFEGLDEHYFRIGVRARFENQLLVDAMTQALNYTSKRSNDASMTLPPPRTATLSNKRLS